MLNCSIILYTLVITYYNKMHRTSITLKIILIFYFHQFEIVLN